MDPKFVIQLWAPASLRGGDGVPSPGGGTVHYGKSSGTRRTFTLEAKISTFVGVLGLHVQFERDLKICKH